jgi:hypothetical protein
MKKKESRLLKYTRTFMAKLLKIDVMYALIKEQQASQGKKIDVAIQDIKIRLSEYAEQNRMLMSLVDVGADVHLRTPGSWAVVCLRGRNDRGVVQFYSLPDDIAAREIATILHNMQPSHHERIILDTPPGIGQSLREEINRL